MNVKYICTLVATFATGVCVGVFFTKKYYRNKTESEIASIKAVYTIKKDSTEKPSANADATSDKDAEVIINTRQSSSIDNHVPRKQENYVKYNFGISDEEPINFSEAVADHEADEMSRRRSEVNAAPIEIDEENVDEIPSYGRKEFFYFQGDSTLTDDLNDIVDDKRRYLGDAIETIDNNSNDMIFLRDDRTSNYFIVHIYPGRYADEDT